MKAIDYVNKYGEDLTGEDHEKRSEAVKGLINDMMGELIDIMETRHVSTDKGAFSVVKELNQKWNAINGKLSIPVLSQDGFKKLMIHEIPGLEKYI